MKTRFLKGIFSLFVLSVFCISCNNVAGNSENEVEYDSIVVNQTYHLLNNPDNPNCDFHISFTYPKSADADLLKAMQQFFVGSYFGDTYENVSPEEAVTQYTKEYIDAYKELEVDFKEELKRSSKDSPVSAWFSYYETSSNEIKYNKYGLVCTSIYFENYTGGAHGSHSLTHHIFSMETAKRLTEEDIFVEDYQEPLSKIIVSHLVKENKAASAKELEDMGFFSVDEIFPNDNFLIDDTGITYTFNEYEIAPYSAGRINVHIPFDELDTILKKESPISKMLKEVKQQSLE